MKIFKQIQHDLTTFLSKVKKHNLDLVLAFVFLLIAPYVGVTAITFAFVFYIAVTTHHWADIFAHYFEKQKTMVDIVYAFAATLFLFTIVTSIAVIFWKLSFLAWLAIYTTITIITGLFSLFYKKEQKPMKLARARVFFSKKIYQPIIIILLFLSAFLFMTPATGVIFSPWHAFGVELQMIIFLALVAVGLLIYSQWTYKYILLALVFLSFVMHSYLPLSHIYPWGGDVWRMIGVEGTLSAGDAILPTLATGDISYREVLGVQLPDVFFVPHKFAYGHIWSITTLLSKHLSISLELVNKWLIPIIWSLFVPVFFYQIGLLLFNSRRIGLLLSWMSLLPFTFQVLGAITLPNSFGFIYFLFVFSLFINSAQKQKLHRDAIVLLFLIGACFGYSLYVVVLFAIYILSFLYKKIKSKNGKKLYAVSTFIGAATMFPLIDLMTKTSYISFSNTFVHQVKNIIGSAVALFIAKAPVSIDILPWNIIVNQTPSHAFVPSIFTLFRWHLVVLLVLVWVAAAVGFSQVKKQKEIKQKTTYILYLLSSMSFIGYVIGWYALDGDRLFTRRIDALFGLSFVLFGFIGARQLFLRYGKEVVFKQIKYVYIVMIILFSWLGTTVYALGPDIRSTSQDEYLVGTFFAENQKPNYCYLSGSYEVLVLESKTNAKIVGGNFAIDYQFGQKERLQYLDLFYKSIDQDVSEITKNMLSSNNYDGCYLGLNIARARDQRLEELLEVFGEPVARYHTFLVWEVNNDQLSINN